MNQFKDRELNGNFYAMVPRSMAEDQRIKLWHFKVYTFIMSFWSESYGYAFPSREQIQHGLRQRWWRNITRYIEDLESWGYIETAQVVYWGKYKTVYRFGKEAVPRGSQYDPEFELVTGDQ